MRSFTRDGLSFDVRDTGPDNGTPVILLHGFPQTSTSWLAVEPLLHSAGLRTLAPDQRGYSPRARPSSRRAYAMPELTADVIALLDATGHRSAHLVGHDWGGAVGWALAGSAAGRFRSLTVLSTPHPGAMTRAWRSQALKSWYMGAFQMPFLPEALLRGDRVEQMLVRSGLPPEAARRDARRLRQPNAAAGAVNWYRGLPYSRFAPVPPANLPVTYLWGAHDEALGRAAAEASADFVTADHRAGYRFVELDAGHWLPETHPEPVARAVIARVTGENPSETSHSRHPR